MAAKPSAKLIKLLAEWEQAMLNLTNIAKPLVEEEMRLRKEVFALAFPAPTEGVNDLALNAGWMLKGTYKLERKLDAAALPAILDAMHKKKFATGDLVKYDPSVVIKAYRCLPEDAKKIFDQAMTTKPASPTVEIIPPKASTEGK